MKFVKSLFSFFIGILWFYWMTLSLIHYGFPYLIPFELLLIALIYGVIFASIGIIQNPYYRGIFFLFISYLHPFGFNWFVPEVILVNSYFGITKIEFFIFLFAIAIFIKFAKEYKVISLIPLAILLLFFQTNHPQNKNRLKIALSSPNIPQQNRWNPKYTKEIIEDAIAEINRAIDNENDIIILTESAFPVILNNEKMLLHTLKELSYSITIVTGSLYKEGKAYYNTTFYFDKGEYKVAKKVFLVPFGEEIPFPKFIKDIINNLFYNGAEDFVSAKNFFDIKIKGVKFRNAICYEATVDKLFQNAPNQIIATSNNAWFYPSIEPTLQHLLLKFYAKKYGKIIYHSANSGISGVIGY